VVMSQTTSSSGTQSHRERQARTRLEEADSLRQQGQLDRAESICFEVTRRYPDYVAALHTLGLIYLDKRNFPRALDCLVRAQMLDPDNWMTLTALGLSYMGLGAREMAVRTLNQALAIRPLDASIFASLGELYRNEHDYSRAEDAYRKALKLDGSLESSKIGLALCLSALGRYAETANVLQEAFRRGHCSISLLDAMASLPDKTVSIDLLSALDLLAKRQRTQHSEFWNTFEFVRAAALHKVGRYSEAWHQLETANGALFAQYKSQIREETARQERSLARLRAASQGPLVTGSSPLTLFILGPSRSGKSSLELLLRSLDYLTAGYEAPIVETALRRAYQASALPAIGDLDNVTSDLYPLFRHYYLDELTRRARSTCVFTSTLSDHIHHASTIASLVPNVRFVFMRRSPQDTALRIYMSKYLRGNAYAYDLKSIARYLAWYDAMTDLFAQKYRDVAIVVTYESMIADPHTVLSKVGSFAGLNVRDGFKPELVDDRDVARPYTELMGHYSQ
jgi:tetratricopeptide (TPR) repeat protein